MSLDAYTPDGIRRLEDKGVTDVIVGFRIPYIIGPDTEPLDDKIRNLEKFAEKVIAKVLTDSDRHRVASIRLPLAPVHAVAEERLPVSSEGTHLTMADHEYTGRLHPAG